VLRREALFKRGDCVAKIVPTRCQCYGEDRIGRLGAVRYPGTFFFGGNVAIEEPDEAIEVANHRADLGRFPYRDVARPLKMTLVFHLQAPK
jgi:hypothetical protein